MAELTHSTPATENLRLLAIDDEPAISELVAHIASECGYAAVTHHDSRKLVDSDLKHLDVMIVDLRMPGLDGIELIRQLGARKAQTRLILGLDRRILESAQKAANAYGLTVFAAMQRPFRPNDLRKILTTLSESAPPQATEQHAAPTYQLSVEDLEQGILREEIVVHFQPQMSVVDETLEGFEALVRWQHPRLGLLCPSAFIDLAENTRLALPFTYAVVNAVITSSRQIFETFSFTGSVSINIPPAVLTDISFPDHLTQILDRSGLDRSKFNPEIGETATPKDRPMFLNIQARLRMRAIKLSIDDFGIGHFYLERMGDYTPSDELNIDLTLVQKMESDPASLRIVQNASQLGHNPGLKVVAEGVENYETLWSLRRMGCDSAQDYFWARPMAVEQLHAWMAQRQGPALLPWNRATGFKSTGDADGNPRQRRDAHHLEFCPRGSAACFAQQSGVPPRSCIVGRRQRCGRSLASAEASMSEHGCEVRSAQPGLLPLESIKAAHTDVVLMDLDMQNSDGLETVRLIRAHPEIQDALPIITPSASATTSQANKILEVGVNRYMQKPLQCENLLTEFGGLVPQTKIAA